MLSRRPISRSILILVVIATCLSSMVSCENDNPSRLEFGATEAELRAEALELLDFAPDMSDTERLARLVRAAELADEFLSQRELGDASAHKTCGQRPINCDDVFDEDYPFWACPPNRAHLPSALRLIDEYIEILNGGSVEYNGIDCVMKTQLLRIYPGYGASDYQSLRWLISGGCPGSCPDPIEMLQTLAAAMFDFDNRILHTASEVSWANDPSGQPAFTGLYIQFEGEDGCLYGFTRRICFVRDLDPNDL